MKKKIAISVKTGFILVYLDDLLRFESHGKETLCVLRNKDNIDSSITLKMFEEKLKSYNFIRIHNSCLINIDYVDEVSIENGASKVLMEDGAILEVSYRKKAEFIKSLKLK